MTKLTRAERHERLPALVEQCLSMNAMAEQLGVTRTTIRKDLDCLGLELPDLSVARDGSLRRRDGLPQERGEGRLCEDCGVRKLKAAYRRCAWCRENVPCACGKRKTRRATRCIDCRNALRGEEHPAWRGGTTVDADGYVREYRPGHPKANMDRYVKQHVLVMEGVLGRHLLPGENVHHKNGIRSDNRPENLELWISSQPAGQRVEDLVTWANEILERYGDFA